MNNNWTLKEIEDGLVEIIRSQRQLDESFNAESDLTAVGLDSLTMVRVLIAVEEKFGVWLEGDVLSHENLRNVQMMALNLQAVLAEEQSAPPL